jgi:acetyl-CoA carboxylase carboxyl transferase subunit beta
LFDGPYETFDDTLSSSDPLHFVDKRPYLERLRSTQEATQRSDALVAAAGALDGREVEICAMEYAFIGGSMGSVVGEKIARAIDRCLYKRRPLLIVSASGGARMQEGAISLMQMAKISAGLMQLDEAKLPYISVLTDPTTGGVTASYAMLGDLNIAEPGALIGFAGPRVIEQTIRKSLPEGFQRSEFLLKHGMLDAVVPRLEMKAYIATALKFFCN